MIRRKRSLMMVLCCGATLMFAGHASAINLATFDFEDEDNIVDSAAAGVTVGNFLSTGFSKVGFDGSTDSRAEAKEAFYQSQATTNNYFSFDVSSAQTINAEMLKFNLQTERRGSSRDATVEVSVIDAFNTETFYSFDFTRPAIEGGATLTGLSSLNVGQNAGHELQFEDRSGLIEVDLTGLATTSMQVRIYSNRIDSLAYLGSADNVMLLGELSDDAPPPPTGLIKLLNFTFDDGASPLSIPGVMGTDLTAGPNLDTFDVDSSTADKVRISDNNGGFDLGTYLEFGVSTDNPVDMLDLAELMIDTAQDGSGRAADFELRSSLDAFGSVIDTSFGNGPQTFDLSALPLINDLTFRLFSKKSGGLSYRLDLDDFMLVGEFVPGSEGPVVPEPMTALMGVLGLGGLALRRRR